MNRLKNRRLTGIFVILAAILSLLAVAARLPIAVSSTPCPSPITTNTTLTADCSGTIAINADGITLNCAGHTITGPGTGAGVGVQVYVRVGVTVKNCKATNWGIGFDVENSPKTQLTGNTATSNSGDGFFVSRSPFSILTGNTAKANQMGFNIQYSFQAQLTGNTASNSATLDGFRIIGCQGCKVTGNTATGNASDGFELFSGDGGVLQQNTNTLQKNRADGNGRWGYNDSTWGTGTYGSGNNYVNNECSGNTSGGSNLAGLHPGRLCMPQA